MLSGDSLLQLALFCLHEVVNKPQLWIEPLFKQLLEGLGNGIVKT